MDKSSKRSARRHIWQTHIGSILSRLLGPRSRGAVTLGKTNSHGFITTALAKTSVGAMLQRVGIAPDTITENAQLHEELVRKCTKCTERERCQEWLADPEGQPGAYREFCVNAERLQKMGAE